MWHLSGITSPEANIIIGNGVVLHIPTLMSELKNNEEKGIPNMKSRLVLSSRCHMVFDLHQHADGENQPGFHVGNPLLFVVFQLAHQCGDMKDNPVPNDYVGFWAGDSTGDEMELVGDVIDDNSVTCVAPSLTSAHKVRFSSEHIYNFPFAFISPLRSQYQTHMRLCGFALFCYWRVRHCWKVQ